MSDSRQHDIRIQNRRNPIGQFQSLEPGDGQHHRVVFVFLQLPQTSLHIAPDPDHFQIGTTMPDLSLATRTPRPHLCTGRQHLQTTVGLDHLRHRLTHDQRIAGPPAFGHRCQQQSINDLRRQILETVNSEVGTTVKHSNLDFAGEHSGPAHRIQPLDTVTVPLGAHLHKLHHHARLGRLEQAGNVTSLPERQPTGSRGDPDHRIAHTGSPVASSATSGPSDDCPPPSSFSDGRVTTG